jgi:hypothetical protein
LTEHCGGVKDWIASRPTKAGAGAFICTSSTKVLISSRFRGGLKKTSSEVHLRAAQDVTKLLQRSANDHFIRSPPDDLKG